MGDRGIGKKVNYRVDLLTFPFFQERPTTTIAVGDPLQFKLETQEGENLLRY